MTKDGEQIEVTRPQGRLRRRVLMRPHNQTLLGGLFTLALLAGLVIWYSR